MLQVVREEKNLILNLTIDVMFLTVSVLLYRNSHIFQRLSRFIVPLLFGGFSIQSRDNTLVS